MLQVAVTPDKKALLNGTRFFKDLTPNDFEAHKKALPIMKTALKKERMLDSENENFFIEGKVVPLDYNSEAMYLTFNLLFIALLADFNLDYSEYYCAPKSVQLAQNACAMRQKHDLYTI